jgi:FkbM family methyltransferase
MLNWCYGEEEQARVSTGWNTKNLRKRKRFWPATLIDAGVGPGTLGLYEAFPEAHLVLIEPLQEFKPDLERLVSHHGGEYVLTSVGATEGSATLHVDPKVLQMSSVLRSTIPRPWTDEPPQEREVPMTTLDALLEERDWRPPHGLKIDTEGYEYQVIQGATRLLEQTEFVIAELNVIQQWESDYCFGDFIALMQSHGFHVCDVLDGRKALNRDVIYLDVMFQRGPPRTPGSS